MKPSVASSLLPVLVMPLLLMGVASPARGALDTPPAQSARQAGGLEAALRAHVAKLAGEIGERNLMRNPQGLAAAARYIEESFEALGLSVSSQRFLQDGHEVRNLVAEIPGHGSEAILLLGAHYDSVPGSPGANDNASGVAALLELARLLKDRPHERSLRFVAFVNEEPPFFKTEQMGSRVYARQAAERGDAIAGMFSLETLGYYSDERNSQFYPLPLMGLFYPDAGNFAAFVSNLGSGALLRRSLAAFRRHSDFPVQGLAAPGWVVGVDFSDQWSFWQEDYPAMMITDTAFYRYPYYHSPRDTPDRLSYPELARLVEGLARALSELAGPLERASSER